jgi:hypothetical protein
MSLTITIGWTLMNVTDADREYVPFSDGYRPGTPQHEIAFIVDGYTLGEMHGGDGIHPLDSSRVAEACFSASNQLGAFGRVDDEGLTGLIADAITEDGYNGGVTLRLDRATGLPATVYTPPEAVIEYRGHFSLSVGDTVTVDGQMLACENTGWRVVFPEEQPCANCGRSIFKSGADNRFYHRVEGTAECPNRGEPGNAGYFPLFAQPGKVDA